MELNRRDFLTVPAAAMATSLFAADTATPWQRRIRHVGQTNMTEHDPVVLDVEQRPTSGPASKWTLSC
jgi:hypothetical protein